MRNIHKYTAALLSTVMILSLLLTGCSGRKDDGTVTITNVSYDPTREFYEKYNKIFESYYESEHSKKDKCDSVTWRLGSTGALGCGGL